MIRFMVRATRTTWYGLWTVALLIGLPWALVRFVGWPLPHRVPTAEQIAEWLDNPLETQRAIKLGAVLIWLIWAFFVLAVAVEIHRRVRAPRIHLTTPMQGIAASLVGATVAALSGGTAHAAPPAEPTDTAVAAIPHPDDVHHTAPPAGASEAVYVVARGDWLGAIAERFLGRADAYPRLQTLNTDLEARDPRFPDHIEPGWRLRLPADAHDRGVLHHATGHIVAARPTHVDDGDATPVAPTERPAATTTQPTPTSELVDSGEPHQEGDDELDAVVGNHTGAMAGAGLLASLLFAVLTAERRRQRSFFLAGQEPPRPRDGRAERELRAARQPADVERLDAALRDLGHGLSGRDAPNITGVRLVGADVQVLLAEPDEDPPEPWLDEGTQWALPGYVQPPATDHPATLLPLLVTIGSRAGRHLLIDLERLATLTVTGHPGKTRELLRHIVCELACATWTQDTTVLMVGFGGEAALLTDVSPDRIHAIASTAEAAASIRSQLSQSSDGSPLVLVVADCDRADLPVLEVLHKELVAAGRCRTAVVASIVDGTPFTDAVLAVSEAGQLRANVPGLRLTTDAASMPADLLEPMAQVFRVARLTDPPPPRLSTPDSDPLDPAGGVLSLFDPTALAPTSPEVDWDSVVGPVTARPPHPAAAQLHEAAVDADLAAWRTADPDRPRISILGPMAAHLPGELADHRHRLYIELLLFLLTRTGHSADRAQIEDALWYGNPAGEGSIRAAIARIRKWLGPRADGGEWISEGSGPERNYRLADGVLLDWHLMLHLRDRADDRGEAGVTDYRAALELVRGVPMRDLPDRGKYRRPYTWIGDSDIAPGRIIAAITDIAHRLAAHSLDHGDTTTARWAVNQAWLADPDRGVDDLWLDLMRAEHLDGHTATQQHLLTEFLQARDAEVPEDLPSRTYNLIRALVPDAR